MNIKIAHVTYKNSSDAHTIYRRYYYEIEEVRLVEMAPYFLQPGCIEMTSIMELPDDCLIQIFKLCGLFDQAALSVTCERFRNLMVNNIFHEIKVFRFENWNDRKVIIAASQVIQSINPLNFELTEVTEKECLCFSIIQSLNWPFKSLQHVNLFDRNATMLDHLLLKFDCDKRVLNITHPLFNEYNDSFEKISDRFECLIILNVNRKDLDTTVTFKTMFRSVTSLFIESGTDIDVPKINNLNFLPNLQKMYFLSFFFGKDATIKSYYELNPNLREVYVAHCSFFSDKSFVKFLCYEENHDITVKYDYLTFRSSSIRRVKLERVIFIVILSK